MGTLPKTNCFSEIADLIKTLHSENTFEECCHKLLDFIETRITFEQMVVIMLGNNSGTLHIKQARGISKTFQKNFKRNIGTGIIGEILWERKIFNIQKTTTDKDYLSDIKMEKDWTSAILTPIPTEGKVLGFLGVYRKDGPPFPNDQLGLVQLFGELIGLFYNLFNLKKLSENLNRWDSLTETLNRAAFIDQLRIERNRTARYKSQLSVALFDLDKYVNYCNIHGLDEGNILIKEVSNLIKANIRALDIIGRYGSDQIVIAFPGADKSVTSKKLKDLRELIEKFGLKGKKPQTTASIGWTHLEPKDGSIPVASIFKSLNAALFNAKRGGRNQVFGISLSSGKQIVEE